MSELWPEDRVDTILQPEKTAAWGVSVSKQIRDAEEELARLSTDPGRKFDQAKPRFDLLFEGMPRALEEVARVLTFGSIKYEDHNWMLVSRAEHRYLAAGMRHEMALQQGESLDPDSGLHHLAHKLCCDLFRLELLLREDG